MDDLINRAELFDELNRRGVPYNAEVNMIINGMPSAQPKAQLSTEDATFDTTFDCISRQAAIDALWKVKDERDSVYYTSAIHTAVETIEQLPSAQPERRCVNCGRTVNNGGWYEDGRTRCPIEEHYALPKDGYCHLWEKRKDWEDDYVKRAEEGEK